MKKKYRKLKSLRAGRWKPGIGRYVVGASLIVLGAQAARADDAITPQQWYEGGTNSYNNWIELSTGALLTQGNANQATQGKQLNTGVFGGIEDLHYEDQVAKKTTLTLDGHSIFDDHDYSAGLGLVRDDMGFVRVHFENFRTWDSGNGGFLPDDGIGGTAFSLPGDALALDRGLISFEAGLTKPNLPKITFKYSHWYRDGDESSTLWGPVHDNGSIYRPYPGIYSLDEKSDTFQLDLAHHYQKVNYDLGLSYTLGNLNDAHKLTLFEGEGLPTEQQVTDQQGISYDLFSTHASADTWLKKNLFLSTGFLYSRLDDTFSGSRIYGDDFDVAYSPTFPGADFGYFNLNGSAHKNDYIWNVNLMSLPNKNWTIIPSLRVQKEDWDANSAGTGTLGTDTGNFNANSTRDSIDVTERLDFRYTGVTNWVFNFGGQWMEGQGNLYETNGLTQVGGIGINPVLLATDDSRLFQKYFASARWYPVPHASLDFGGYYKINQYNYNNTQDSTPNDLSTGNAYPGFLLYQGFQTWDGSIRLTLRLPKNIMLVSRYEYQYSTISTEPDPASDLSEVDSSKMYTHIIGQNASWTPLDWLGLQAGFNYVLSTTKTPASDYTQAVLDAQNNYWTINFNSDFVLDDKTDLNIGYFYYRAADGQNNIVDGVPLGTDTEEHSITAALSRRITQNLRLNLKYAYTHYDDLASSGHFSYDAQVIFASLQFRF